MGIFDRLGKKVVDAIDKEDTTNIVENDKIEKTSYSAYSYKKVQKLREKGKYWGTNIPYLQYPLKKQEKPRALFLVLGILYAIIFACILAFSVVVIINFIIPIVKLALNMGDKVELKWWDAFGVTYTFMSLAPLLLWLIIIFVLLLLFAINFYFGFQTYKLFALSKVSMQEIAKGYEINDLIFKMSAIILITITIGIVILVLNYQNMKPAGFALIIGVMAVVSVIIGLVLALLIVERIKAKKEFDQLSEEEQQDFIKHNNKLDYVRRRKNRNNRTIAGSSKVDF